ncbi:MAG: leucine-rich repeat domain-containing protein [Lachnospiraceae bacterium]|nr:leucine-rich repeat domain-containing protein [Lachnospiraceae bacterium]
MVRKIIGLLCFVTALISVSEIAAHTIFADAAEKPGEISQGENITKVRTKFDEATGTLTVSGKGDMPKDMTFRGNKEIRKVVVKKGITSICDWAFFDCNNIKSIELPEGLLKIGVDSFGMTNIKDLVIPSSVKIIGQCAFWGCKSLETITMPGDFKLQYNEDDPDESEFRLVSTYEWSGFAPKKITFTTPLNIDNISALSATDYVVSDDDPLYSSIDGAIYSKDGTALVRIPSERTEFRVPVGVNTVYINSFHYSFYMEDDEFCVRLEKLYLPKGKCTIAKKMTEEEEFNLDSNYLQIIADGTKLDGRSLELLEEYAGRLYDEAESSKEWYLTGFSELVTLRKDGCLVSNDGIVLKYFGDGGKVKLGNDIKGIAREAFKFSSITGIKMSDSIVYIGEKAFYDTKNLKSVKIPKSVTEWGRDGSYSYAFSGSGLKKIVFEDGIEEIPNSICSDCYKLKTVVFPKTLKKIGSDAFRYCISLNIDKFSGFKDFPNLTSIGSGAFENCKMKKFVIPEQITEIGFHAFNIDRENAKKAKLVVMGYTEGYDDSFWGGKAVPVFKKGFSQAKCGLSWGSYLSQPDKNGMLWIKLNWNSLKGADGYEIEVSVHENFAVSEKRDVTGTEALMEMKSDKADPEAIYARVRAYKSNDDRGTRKYSGWSNVVCRLERN